MRRATKDKLQIAAHVAVAIATTAIAANWGWHWWALAANAIFWPAREEIQGWLKYKLWLTPDEWSRQKALEALLPLPASFLVACAGRFIEGKLPLF